MADDSQAKCQSQITSIIWNITYVNWVVRSAIRTTCGNIEYPFGVAPDVRATIPQTYCSLKASPALLSGLSRYESTVFRPVLISSVATMPGMIGW
jgi:hypothetical protein